MNQQFLTLAAQWATEHWWLAFWLAFWALAFTYMIIAGASLTIRLLLRTIRVAVRGWPPAHLDADGDWKPEPERATEPAEAAS